jgi:hypothetical protein
VLLKKEIKPRPGIGKWLVRATTHHESHKGLNAWMCGQFEVLRHPVLIGVGVILSVAVLQA